MSNSFGTQGTVQYFSEDSSSGKPVPNKSTSGADHTLEQGQIGGERNSSSSTNNYDIVHNESNGVVISAGVTAKTVSSAPCFLRGIYIVPGAAASGLVGTLTIAGLLDETGTAANVVLPAATPQGFIDFFDARCESTLVVTKSSASDDARIVVFMRPIT